MFPRNSVYVWLMYAVYETKAETDHPVSIQWLVGWGRGE